MKLVRIDTSCVVKVRNKVLTIHTDQIAEVKYRVRAWSEEGTMMFESAMESHCPDGLVVFPCLVAVPCGASKVVKIEIQNSTQHDIYLSQRTVLGRVEKIADIRPVITPNGESVQ